MNDYSCDCNNGWTGRNCEIDINECNITSVCVQGSCTVIREDGAILSCNYYCDLLIISEPVRIL